MGAKAKVDRNHEIFRRRLEGESLSAIAQDYPDISYARVAEIWREEQERFYEQFIRRGMSIDPLIADYGITMDQAALVLETVAERKDAEEARAQQHDLERQQKWEEFIRSEASRVPLSDRWIEIESCSPHLKVALLSDGVSVVIATRNEVGGQWLSEGVEFVPSHWMPIPVPPRLEE